MSSNFTPDVRGSTNFVIPGITVHVENLFFPGGSTQNNVSLVEESEASPIGFLHFHQNPPGDINVTGLVFPFVRQPDIGMLLFLQNDGPSNVILIESSVLSRDENRFSFGGSGDITMTPTKAFPLLYDPDTKKWVTFG